MLRVISHNAAYVISHLCVLKVTTMKENVEVNQEWLLTARYHWIGEGRLGRVASVETGIKAA